MNLIERLGGYEKAKEIVFDPLHPQMTHVSNDGRHWVNENFSYIPEIQSQIPKMARIDDIRKALLEYRRQHNIFEVGDKVVVLTNALGNKYTWMVESIDGIMVEISQLGQSNEWVHYSEIAHTTPKEIKAGKRLEVK